MLYTSERKSKISNVFLLSFKAHDIAETVRRIDATTACAQSLLYDFSLKDSFKNADDLKISFELFQKGRPHEWQKFFEAILDHPNISKEMFLGIPTSSRACFTTITMYGNEEA